MNHFRRFGITVLALSMGFGGLASAQDRDRGGDRDHPRVERRGTSGHDDRYERSARSDRRDHRSDTHYRAGHDAPRAGYNQRGEWRDARGEWRGAGPGHDLRRGGHLNSQFRSRQYVVDDWRGHRLTPPPRGYHWVQAGGDYVLAAIATGLIVQLVLNN